MGSSYLFNPFFYSKDDSLEIDTRSEPEIDVILVGEDSERIYQSNNNSLNKEEVQCDLTQELGLSSSLLSLLQNGNIFSFYTFASGNFSLIQENVETGVSSL